VAVKENFHTRGALYFRHPMPFIPTHGFTGLKFIQNTFQNSPLDILAGGCVLIWQVGDAWWDDWLNRASVGAASAPSYSVQYIKINKYYNTTYEGI
jgi:hypothetical protein